MLRQFIIPSIFQSPVIYRLLLVLALMLKFQFIQCAKLPLTLTLKDAETHASVAFANILFGEHQQGTVSDINGQFSLPEKQPFKYLRISRLGYQTQVISISDLYDHQTIFLQPVHIELEHVTVLPGENPALPIMRKVVDNRAKNNPDETTPYSCIIYHKMTFGMETPDTIDTSDESLYKLWEFNSNNYIMLIESVSERKHLPPSTTNERILSGRVSGFEQPALSVLPSQLQPFTFYSDYIRLLDLDLLNPASRQGLRSYLFLLEHTIIQAPGDTLYYITFEPRKNASIKGMKGSFHIHQATSAIQTVSASTPKNQSPFTLFIRQNYQLQKGKQWFPEQLETRLVITHTLTGQEFPFPIVGEGKSMVTAIDLNPEFNKSDFNGLHLIDESGSKNSPDVNHFRYQPLTARDSATYHLIDSLGRDLNFDRLIHLQKHLMKGYLPMGYLNLDINKLLGFNYYEGIKAGLGLQTSNRLSRVFSTEGFYSRSFRSKDNNFGGGFQLRFHPLYETTWKIFGEKSLAPTGQFEFLEGYEPISDERFKQYSVSVVDPVIKYHTALTSRITTRLKAKLRYQYNEVTPIMDYPYMINRETAPEFISHETGIQLKWQPRIKLAYTGFGLMSMGGDMPSAWLNFSAEQGKTTESFSFLKAETQFEHHFRLTPVVTGSLRFTAGHLWGNHTSTHLYSAFGTYNSTVGIESRYSFATMRPNEFAANIFSLLFLRTTIPTRLNRPGLFKPEITLLSSAGWANVSNGYANRVHTFNQGYYESGIYFGNLVKQHFLKYGIGIHYRYGPYRMNREIENWAFKIGMEIGL